MKEEIFHSIKANLYENYLTEDPNDLTARVISERSLSAKEICKSAVSRGGAQLTADAMEHNVNEFFKEMTYQLIDGFTVTTEYFTASVQIRGPFKNPQDRFDPKRHSVLFRFNQGVTLRKLLSTIKVQIMGMGEVGPVISHVVDSKTGSVNDLITPNGTLKIRGGKIKIAGDHPEVGVFFEDEHGNQTMVAENDIIVNNPTQLIVQIPALIPGRYKLVIITQYSGSPINLKNIRTAAYDKIFTVE